MPSVSSDVFNLPSIRKAASIFFRGDYSTSYKMPIGGFTESNVDRLDISRVKPSNALIFNANPSKTYRGKNLAASNPQRFNQSGSNPQGNNQSGTNPMGETLLPRRYNPSAGNPSASNPQRFNQSSSNPQAGTNPQSGTNQWY